MRYRRTVIKVGTNVITKQNGQLDEAILRQIVEQIATLRKKGVEILLVSSGAMGAGQSLVMIPKKTSDVTKRQILAAVGQIQLMNIYAKLFQTHGIVCAQVLATKEDFRDRAHYLNMKQCLTALIANHIVPIINENDVVSVSELMFTDNDELAGMIASMMNAQGLILLTSVDGILDNGRVIENADDTVKCVVTPEKSSFGRGGMITKCHIAQKLSAIGIATHIANGKKKNVIMDIFDKKSIGTVFAPKKDVSSVKKWIAHAEGYEKGVIHVNKGAEQAILSDGNARSLLLVGVTKIEGEFKKGDIVKIQGSGGSDIGYGKVEYSAVRARELLGQKGKKPIIHYDYLYVSKA